MCQNQQAQLTDEIIADEVATAMRGMTGFQICELRNMIKPEQVTFYTENGYLSFTLVEIESWADRIGLTYDILSCGSDNIWHYELNGCRVSIDYRSEKEAMIAAFEEVIVKQADLSDYDLFTCQKCDKYFDIEDSVQIDDDELYCGHCAESK